MTSALAGPFILATRKASGTFPTTGVFDDGSLADPVSELAAAACPLSVSRFSRNNSDRISFAL